MHLRWQPILQEVSSLRLLQFVHPLLTAADLDSIDSIFLLGFYLNNLAPVDLDHCAGSVDAPAVPEVSHTDLVAEETHSFGVAVYGFCLYQLIVPCHIVHLVL